MNSWENNLYYIILGCALVAFIQFVWHIRFRTLVEIMLILIHFYISSDILITFKIQHTRYINENKTSESNNLYIYIRLKYILFV